MNRAALTLDVIQSAHWCMAFVDAELRDLPEAERPHLVAILAEYIDTRRDCPTPRHQASIMAGERQVRLLFARERKGEAPC